MAAGYVHFMRTTVYIPDDLLFKAKKQALEEKTSVTELIVKGLYQVIHENSIEAALPVSQTHGGLLDGIAWDALDKREQDFR